MSRRSWLWRSSVILLLLLFWSRALVNIRDQSPIVDEPVHLTRGMAYWQTGDLRLQYGHPPLPHALIGSLLTLEPAFPAPDEIAGWSDARRIDIARHFLWDGDRPVERLLLLGRWPVLALGVLLSALTYRWATELFNPLAGGVALMLITFDPNTLAHTSLATADLPVTCLMVVACYAFHRWLNQPSVGNLLLAGATLGLAWGAKLSALVLIPVLGFVLLWRVWQGKRNLLGMLPRSALIVGIAFLTLWAVYRFELGQAAGVWMPMPTHWENLKTLWQHQEQGHNAFFCGQISHQGWWYYFPTLFLIKTPIPLLILLLGAGIMALYRRQGALPPVMLLFPALYFAASIISNINIGYRHILPVIPFLTISAASIFNGQFLRSRWRTGIQTGMLAWLALSSLLIHPYYLAYFNEVIGGPKAGYQYAVDSNLDWGQDLKRLSRYARANEIDHLRISYFGTAEPDHYLSSYEVLETAPFESSAPNFHPFNPQPGVYAISASHLQGLPFTDADIFDWFRRREPTARIGYSIFVYRVQPDERQPGWVASCRAPTPPLGPEKLAIGLGRADLRHIHFDCTSSWIYPAGEKPGWYIIPGHQKPNTLLPAGTIVFCGRSMKGRPALTVYRWNGKVAIEERLGDRPSKEVLFGDTAEFLGSTYQKQAHPGETITLFTYWRVQNRPGIPLSIMAHLTDEQGNVIAVGDGLGVTVDNWRPGDVIVQAHSLAIAPEASPGPYTPRIGLYFLESLERIPLADGTADALALDPIHVVSP